MRNLSISKSEQNYLFEQKTQAEHKAIRQAKQEIERDVAFESELKGICKEKERLERQVEALQEQLEASSEKIAAQRKTIFNLRHAIDKARIDSSMSHAGFHEIARIMHFIESEGQSDITTLRKICRVQARDIKVICSFLARYGLIKEEHGIYKKAK